MHDAIGRPLKEGDRVFVPAVVTGVFAGEDYCNVHVDTVIGRRPDNKPERISGINSGVFLRANPGDANDIEKWASPDGKWLGEQAVTPPFKARVRDKVTGFIGAVTGRAQWLDESDTVLAVNEKGESRWIKVHHAEQLDTASAA